MFDQALSDPDALVRLAASRDSSSRHRLALAMAEACAARDLRDTNAGALVEKLLVELAHAASSEIRLRLAEKLANVPWAPRDLIVQLANDEIDIARPVIQASVKLLDVDLITLAEHKGVAHRIEIAKRPNLSAFVSDALSAGAEPIVLTALVKNASASLTRKTLNACLDAAREHRPIRRPLSERDELSNDLAAQLYVIVGEELRGAIAARFTLDERRLAPLIAEARDEAFSGSCGSPEETEDNARALAEKLHRAGRIGPSMIVKAARESRIELFDHALAHVIGAPPSVVRRALGTGGAWAVALACRAAGVERGAFPTVHASMARAGRAPARLSRDSARAASKAFTSMSPASARETLRRLGGEV